MDYIHNKITSLVDDGVDHYQSLDANLNRLKRKCEELNCRKEDVELQLKAELKPGKKLKEEVNFWLATVRRINEVKQSIIEEKQSIENRAAPMRIVLGSRLGKLVVEKILEVEEHHQKGSFSDGLVVDESPSSGVTLPTTTLAGETTAKKNMEEIWDCLMNDEIRTIGVYGIGGIGKTSIMKHINNRLLKETDKFDNVFWVTVSKGVDVFKLQDAIARVIEEDLSRWECETTRAAKLFSKLSKKKRYVFILDDVWEAFELENVGIPKPTLDNGCKIVLTTRSLDVCRRMNCKNLKMELLSKEEAWNLFLDKVGRDVLHTPGLKPIMKLVAKECARLPLAIVTIARSMKDVVDKCEWRNALEELRQSTGGLNDMGKVLEQLQYSYIRLKDKKIQQCLLYCALYPEDFEIERRELIKHLIDEGIIEGTSRQAEFDKGHSILNKLENSCLLENVKHEYKGRCVKMHDLIRDMALQIMGPTCIVKAGVLLRDFPDEEKWIEDLEQVSLMHSWISELSSCASLRCSRLSTLLLSHNFNLKRIADSFFMHMHGLRVLDLSYTSIVNMPNSISDLENLAALLLRGCWDLKYVPSLAKLGALRNLDLKSCGIREAPQGMEMLVNLRCLNLVESHLCMLPAGILPKLSRLQHLFVLGVPESLKLKGEEVASLSKLETFVGQFDELNEFNTYARSVQSQWPHKYFFVVGARHQLYANEEWSYVNKDVILRKCSINRGGEDTLVLPKDIVKLDIEECHDVRSLCDVPSLNNATDFLRYCRISHCEGIECMLSSFSSSHGTPLQRLRVLELYTLPNLSVLFKGEGAPPPPGIFSCLQCLQIESCPNINKLFMPWLLPYLQNLVHIEVRHCEKMEVIITAKAEGEEEQEGLGESYCNDFVADTNDTIIPVTLPKLRTLTLKNLPELKGIVSRRGIMVCDSLHYLQVKRCKKLKRLPLSLPMINGRPSPPPALGVISAKSDGWWESLEWDNPYAKDVLQPFLDPV